MGRAPAALFPSGRGPEADLPAYTDAAGMVADDPAKAPDFTVYASVVQLSDILSHLWCNPDSMAGQDLIPAFKSHLPHIETQWRSLDLPWEVLVLETWFAWLKIERENGSSIITILSS